MAVIRYRDGKGNIVPLHSIQGDDGNQMYVRFSAYADGTDMSETWDAERNYMGIAFAYRTPTNKADYQWIPMGIEGAARIACGSYVGTGKGGTSNRNTLTFAFAPKVLFLVGDAAVTAYADSSDYDDATPMSVPSLFWVDGITSAKTNSRIQSLDSTTSEKAVSTRYFSVSGNTLTWYASMQFESGTSKVDLQAQMNESGKTYKYIAIG